MPRLSGENLGGYFYEVSEVQLQLLGKLLDGDDFQFRPVNVFENVEVSVVGHDIFCIGCYGAINKLVVVGISLYQPEMVIDFHELRCVKSGNGLNHVAGNLGVGFLTDDFLVFAQDVSIYAQDDVPGKYLSPYLVIRTATGQSLQQAVGVKNDASHRCKVCACALRPIAQWSVR